MTKRYAVTPALLSACASGRRVRESHNESQVDAANALNMPQGCLSRIESGSFGVTISEDLRSDLVAVFRRYKIEEPRWIETTIKRTSAGKKEAEPQKGPIAFSPAVTGSFHAMLDHVLGMVSAGKIAPADAKVILLATVASK